MVGATADANDAAVNPSMDVKPSRLARMPLFLTWEIESRLPAELQADYLRALAGAFAAWSSADDKAESCREIYSFLTPVGRSRFLSSPDISFALLTSPKGAPRTANGSRAPIPPHPVLHELPGSGDLDADIVRERLLAERLRTGNLSPRARHTQKQIGHDLGLPSWKVDVKALVREAERTGRGADACCNWPNLPDSAPYAESDCAFLEQRLSRCLDLIERIGASARKMISQVLRAIVFRQDQADPRGFSSSSWPGKIGTIGIINAHRGDLDDAWLIDALIHECIHSLLYMVEIFEPFYMSADAPTMYRSISPWSGKLLYLHSYVHACFVWFGLWCFWSLALESGFSSGREIEFFRDRAQHGFEADILERLGSGREGITEQVQQAISTMREIVLGTESNSRQGCL